MRPSSGSRAARSAGLDFLRMLMTGSARLLGVGYLLTDKHHGFLGTIPLGTFLGVQHGGRHGGNVLRPGQIGQSGHRAAANLRMIVRGLLQQQGHRTGRPPGFDQPDPSGSPHRVFLCTKLRGDLFVHLRIADEFETLPCRFADRVVLCRGFHQQRQRRGVADDAQRPDRSDSDRSGRRSWRPARRRAPTICPAGCESPRASPLVRRWEGVRRHFRGESRNA